MKKIKKYFKDLKKEIAKVRWPNKKEMVKYSIATISFLLFFSLMFYVVDITITFLRAL